MGYASDAHLFLIMTDPNGTSIYMTYLKTQLPGYTGYRFPKCVMTVSVAQGKRLLIFIPILLQNS